MVDQFRLVHRLLQSLERLTFPALLQVAQAPSRFPDDLWCLVRKRTCRFFDSFPLLGCSASPYVLRPHRAPGDAWCVFGLAASHSLRPGLPVTAARWLQPVQLAFGWSAHL